MILTNKKQIIIWEVLLGKIKSRFTVSHKNIVTCITLMQKAHRFATGSSDSIKIWKLTYQENPYNNGTNNNNQENNNNM